MLTLWACGIHTRCITFSSLATVECPATVTQQHHRQKGPVAGKNRLHTYADSAHRQPLLLPPKIAHARPSPAHFTDTTTPPHRPATARHREQEPLSTATAAGARCKDTTLLQAHCSRLPLTVLQLLGPAPPLLHTGWLLMRPLWSWTWSAPQQPSQSGPCRQQQQRDRGRTGAEAHAGVQWSSRRCGYLALWLCAGAGGRQLTAIRPTVRACGQPHWAGQDLCHMQERRAQNAPNPLCSHSAGPTAMLEVFQPKRAPSAALHTSLLCSCYPAHTLPHLPAA